MIPFFTIIVPTYQSQEFISNAIESIIQQTFTDFEIIVADGLSVDRTLFEIEKFKDDRIKIFSESDDGVYDAMNKGIRLAKGKWLYFLGSDDLLHDGCVLEDVARFINGSDEALEVVYGNVRIIGCNHWASDGDIYDGKFDLQRILEKNVCHQSVFYQADFIRTKIGYYNLNYRVCSDWDFNLRCWARTKCLYMDRIIADFKAGGESTRNMNDLNFSKDYLGNVVSYFNFDLFDREINRRTFMQYGRLLSLQKKQRPIKWFLFRLKAKLADLIG